MKKLKRLVIFFFVLFMMSYIIGNSSYCARQVEKGSSKTAAAEAILIP